MPYRARDRGDRWEIVSKATGEVVDTAPTYAEAEAKIIARLEHPAGTAEPEAEPKPVQHKRRGRRGPAVVTGE